MRKIFLILRFFVAFCLIPSLNAEENLEEQFETRYQAWKEVCYELRGLSQAGPRFTCNEFKEIVNLGLPALPYIARKMEYDSNRGLLWKAIEVIAKVKIIGEYDRETNKTVFPQFPELKPGEDPMLYWWREGHKLTPSQFNELYSNWRQMKESDNEEAGKIYQKMINLGLPVIPLMIEKLENGDNDLLPAISVLTDGEISEDASPTECIQQWNNNKEKWTIKFNESESNENRD
jgi:hypothetical protein